MLADLLAERLHSPQLFLVATVDGGCGTHTQVEQHFYISVYSALLIV